MATLTVTNAADSGAGSLRQAVLDANAADGRDAIVFGASFDGGAEDVIRLTSGQIAITERLRIDGGPGVTITGDAAGDDVTDAAGITDVAASGARRLDDNSRIFDVADRLTLDGLTLTGGRAQDNGDGGAVRSARGELTLVDCVVSGNSAGAFGYGGGISGSRDVTVRNSTVSGNTAGDGGGGGISGLNVAVRNSVVSGNSTSAYGSGGGISGGDVTVSNSTVNGNSAGNDGGGIHGSNVSVMHSTVTQNSAEEGGGGIFGFGTIRVAHSTVSRNTAVGGGGGIGGYYEVFPDIILRNSTVSGNLTTGNYGLGGGILAWGGLTVGNSTVSGNHTAVAGGGGIFALGGDSEGLTVRNSTISGNSTAGFLAAGGGINFSGGYSGDLTAVLTNTIVLGNRAINAGADEFYGALALTGGNIVGRDVFSGMSDIGNTTAGKVFDATVAIGDGVRAGRLADNSGPTRTIALNPDAFNPALGGANSRAPARDQRDLRRDAAPDLGAFEAEPVDGVVLRGGGRGERLTGGVLDDQIYGRDGDDILLGLAGRDQLRGEFGQDRLRGGHGRDVLDGAAGQDRLKGGRGDDQLSGGAGGDYLRGGLGDDLLSGGTGPDRFVFAAEFGHDAIVRFDARPAGGQDRIDLRAFGFSPDFPDFDVFDFGEDAVVRVFGGGTILCRGVSGDGANTIDEADFLL